MKILTKVIMFVVAVLLVNLAVYLYLKSSSDNQSNTLPPSSKILMKETDYLSVRLTYPAILGNGKEITQANSFLEEDINKRIDAFSIEAQNNSMSADIGLPKEVKSTVTGSPAIEEDNERYISIFMGMEWYARGAAHPSHSIDTYIYDYKRKSFVSVADLFKEGSDYLSLLSTLSKEDLLLQSKEGDLGYVYDESFVKEGTMPTKENFARVLPLKDGLAIYFDEYQVAPYAAGPQQVVIPYAKLKDIINPSSVLGMYIH